MKPTGPNLFISLVFVICIALSCVAQSKHPAAAAASFKKLEGYTIRGYNVTYYRIPAHLSREDLVKITRKICDAETDRRLVVQLILVDDISGLAKYIDWAKRASNGDETAKMPTVWADKHIIANVQKTLKGGWLLYESYGYKEIAVLEPKGAEKK
jgi:hypothetical protein